MKWILRDIPFGKNIKKIRKSKKMTQKKLVTEMQLMGSKISRSTLSNIEGERRNIKASDLVILKYVFNVEYEQLLEFDPTKEE